VFPDWSVEAGEIQDLGDRTVAELHARGHGGESETPIDQELWQVAEWSADNKLLRMSNYASEADALKAAGLSEE
jgi:hypothetical protein